MSDSWKSLIEEMDLEETETDSPPGESGPWAQVFSSYLNRGFARVLTLDESAKLAIHGGHPDIDADSLDSLASRLGANSETKWKSAAGDSSWWLVSDTVDSESKASTLGTSLRVAEALARGELELPWLQALEAPSEAEAGESAEAEPEPRATRPESSSEETQRAPGPFEVIGDESSTSTESGGEVEPAPTHAQETAFELEKLEDSVTITLSLGEPVSSSEREATIDALARNLEAKFDVAVQELSQDDTRKRFNGVSLKAVPVDVLGDGAPKVDSVYAQVEGYFSTVVELEQAGVDPLVFLGVRGASKPSSVKTPARGESAVEPESDEPEGAQFVLSLSGPEDDLDDDSVVFEQVYPDDAPLKAGGFDDPRLDEPDSDATLVDVVLRHPGYSDKRVGQVLSILLSIEYHQALRLMKNAPIILARGVGLTRGRELQTLVDRAGGRIKLTDPGRFPPSD